MSIETYGLFYLVYRTLKEIQLLFAFFIQNSTN